MQYLDTSREQQKMQLFEQTAFSYYFFLNFFLVHETSFLYPQMLLPAVSNI